MRTDGEPSARVGRVGFKRARGASSCRGIHYVCFVVCEPTSVRCIATPGPHPTLTDESTLVAHHENPKDTHPEKDINFPLICAHDPRIRVDTPPTRPPGEGSPAHFDATPGDHHVHRPRLLRPSDAPRGSQPPGARATLGRHARRQGASFSLARASRRAVVVVVEVVRANRSMRFPDPPIVGYPSRGARARWLGGGARGERTFEFCAREFRARARTARAGRRRAGTKGATAPYPYPRPEMGPVRVETDLWN